LPLSLKCRWDPGAWYFGSTGQKKRKKDPGHLLEQGRANSSSGASQHSSTRQKKERLQPAVMDIGTPSLHPISICSLSSPYWLVPWLAHDDDRETWKVKEKNDEIMKIITIIIIINKIL